MADDSFGPQLAGHFDFTLRFELIFFNIVPSIISFIAFPFYLYPLARGTPRVHVGLLLWAKLAVAVSLVIVETVALARFHDSYAKHGMSTVIPTVAAVLSFVSAILITGFVYVGHVYYYASPAFLGLFLTITLLLDSAEARSFSLRLGFEKMEKLQIAIPVLKFVLIILEEISKRSKIRDKGLRSSLGREAVAGFWSRSLFFWTNSLMVIGFRNNLTKEDIGDVGFNTEELYNEFAPLWAKANRTSKFALLVSCIKTVPELLIFIVFPRIMSIGFRFALPFLLQRVVSSVSDEHLDPTVAASLIGATALTYAGKTLCTAWFSSYSVKLRISIRGMLVAALYHKSLRLSTDELSKSAVLTLMSTDVNSVQGLISLLYESWARFIEVGLGLGILAAFIGPACIFTLIPAAITSVFSTFATRKMAATRKRWNEQIESRVADTSSILSQIKDIKMTGLAPIMAEHLQKQMDTEVEVSMGDRQARSVNWAGSAFVETATPAFVIAATIFWTRASTGLSVADFYTTLALTSMVTYPFSIILRGLPQWSAAWASVLRVQEYLCKEEIVNARIFTVDEPVFEEKPSRLESQGLDSARLVNGGEKASQIAAQFKQVSVFNLKNASFSVPKGSKTMIRGSVGSGKSTILKSLLGEVELQEGTVSLSSESIAYCDQEPWILNTTIEENIIGNSPRDSERLWNVVRVCALEADLDRLPEGIRTLAGSEGCNLSGGQRQRVALARSLYAGADNLLLDDVFSALDAPTSSMIRESLFRENGFLTGTATTVIMATNISQHLEDADLVFEVTPDGQVQQVLQQHATPEQHAVALKEPPRNGEDPSEVERDQKLPRSVNITSREDESAKQRYGELSIYTYFFRAAGVAQILWWLASVILGALVELFPSIYVRIWLDERPDSRMYYIGYAILSFVNPVTNILSALAFYYLIIAATSKSLHRTLADATFRATFDFLTKEDTSVLLNRFSQDISVATQELPLFVLPTCWLFFTILINIAIIASGANYAAPILPLFLVILYAIQFFYLRTSRQLRFLELDASKALYKEFKESSKGAAHIRAFRWQPGFAKKLYLAMDETQRPIYSLACIQQWLASVLNSATAVAATCVVALALTFTSQTSDTALGLALLSLISFSEILGAWISLWTETETSIGAVSRTRQFGQSTPVEEDPDDTRRLAANVPDSWPHSGHIELQGISARYQAQSTAPRTAFDNVTVSISSGKKVGIIGRTGSGKTSLLLTVLHLLEYSGVIRIDDMDIRQVPRDFLRSRITTITQSGIELPGSVRSNINPFGTSIQPGQVDTTDDMIIDILRRLGSGLWENIESRGGLDVDISDMKFSQGQNQLVQLARAVLHKQSVGSKIVLVDEGSASLDQDTEGRVQAIIEEEFRDCTVLTVSHRPTAVQNVDFFVRMVDGRAEVIAAEEGRTERDE